MCVCLKYMCECERERHTYCKQIPKMRQLGCMSADVYCQKLNNQSYAETSYLYSNGKKGEQARRRRDRERVCESSLQKREYI